MHNFNTVLHLNILSSGQALVVQAVACLTTNFYSGCVDGLWYCIEVGVFGVFNHFTAECNVLDPTNCRRPEAGQHPAQIDSHRPAGCAPVCTFPQCASICLSCLPSCAAVAVSLMRHASVSCFWLNSVVGMCPVAGFIAKLCDFGLARLMDASKAHVSTSSMGTISYQGSTKCLTYVEVHMEQCLVVGKLQLLLASWCVDRLLR